MDSEDSETTGIQLPVDSDGFLRRACKACSREFKWLHSQDVEEAANPYHCPYCGQPGDDWTTDEQYARLASFYSTEEGFASNELEPLQEPDDMRVITPVCHSTAPIKIQEEWTGSTHCHICGHVVDSQRNLVGIHA